MLLTAAIRHIFWQSDAIINSPQLLQQPRRLVIIEVMRFSVNLFLSSAQLTPVFAKNSTLFSTGQLA